MSQTNAALAKADLAIADIQSNNGYLEDEQAAAFVRKLIVQPTLLRGARVVEMMSPARQINKIQFGSRIMRAAPSSGSALSSGDRAKPNFDNIRLTTKEIIAEVRIPYDVMEDNIERGNIGAMTDVGGVAFSGGIRDTIVDLIAERAALDMEELAILGDLSSSDAYLALNDGYIEIGQDEGNTSDQLGDTISKSVFKRGVKDMPDQYLRNRASLVHYVSMDQETEYRDTLADRQTGMGDGMINGFNPVWAFGSRIEPVSLMPQSKGIFTNPLNLIMGIQRRVTFEFDKMIAERMYQIVVTCRLDFKMEEPDAAVIYNNIG